MALGVEDGGYDLFKFIIRDLAWTVWQEKQRTESYLPSSATI